MGVLKLSPRWKKPKTLEDVPEPLSISDFVPAAVATSIGVLDPEAPSRPFADPETPLAVSTALQVVATRAESEPLVKRGKTLFNRIVQRLAERSVKADGSANSRLDDVADAYVMAMEAGSFVHIKEVVDRQEGKVPNRIAGADGENLKLYIGMPVGDAAGAP